LSEAIEEGTYSILRNCQGFTIEDILNMKSSQFWWLQEKIGKEAKEIEKKNKELARKAKRKR